MLPTLATAMPLADIVFVLDVTSSMQRQIDGLKDGIGAFARESVDREPEELAAEYDLDERAARNLSAFLREQREARHTV